MSSSGNHGHLATGTSSSQQNQPQPNGGRSSAKVVPATPSENNTNNHGDTAIRLAPPTQLLVAKGDDEIKAEALAIPHRHFAEMKCEDVLRHFATSSSGLTEKEAHERKLIYGVNQLEKDPPDPWWKMLLEQFSDLLVLMLIAASIVSMALKEYAEGAVIILIVILNAALGVYQESRAGAALEALESLSSPQVIVRREGKEYKMESADLVPGDIVILEPGGKISADMRLLQSEGLSANEMALTGEAEPVHKNAAIVLEPLRDTGKSDEERKAELQARVEQKKDKMKAAEKRVDGPEGSDDDDDDIVDGDDKEGGGEEGASPKEEGEGKEQKADGDKKDDKEEALTDSNCVYLGCAVVEGTGNGVVIKTGMSTKMGEIALLLKEADEDISPLHKKLHALGVRLGLISIFCSVLVFIIGVTTGQGSNPNDPQPVWLQMLLVAVSLTVAAVPEGLPSCVTITLAVGMRNMVKKNALIRNLGSVETLGSATVICTDKTGTLTAGAMTAVQLWYSWTPYKITGEGYNPNGFVVPLTMDDGASHDALNECHERTKSGPQLLPILVGLLCSNQVTIEFKEGKNWEATGNMSERPLVIAARKVGLDQDAINVRYPRAKVNQFNSARKMMSTLVSSAEPLPVLGTPWIACVKGAPNMVLEKCISILELSTSGNGTTTTRALTHDDRDRIMSQVDAYSEQAYRVLAVAYCTYTHRPAVDGPEELETNLVFAGLFAIWDPPRREVEDAIRKAAHAGIRTVMITGDYVKTAKAIAEKIKLLPKGSPANKAVDCQIVRTLGNQLDDIKKELKASKNKIARQTLLQRRADVQRELDAITKDADVFARAKPVDKITIVRSLQRQGEICSMTGDGVNDAPALKQANIGVAMGLTGTDVAKAASDMVLTDDNFRSIVDAIESGRTIYCNISKFVFYLLSTNSAEVFVILIAVVMGLESPLVSMQILWLNLVTDGAPAIALALEPIEPGIMLQGPRRATEPLIEKVMAAGIVVQMILLTGVCLGTYIIGLYWRTGVWDGKPAGQWSKTDTITSLAQYCVSGPNGMAPQECCTTGTCIDRDDLTVQIQAAQTMVMYVIVFAELLRAYTSRAMRDSIFKIGVWSNEWMQWGVVSAVALTIFVGHTPEIQDVFHMQYLEGREWGLVLGLACVPCIVDELQKVVYRITGFGERPRVKLYTDTTEATPLVVKARGSTTHGHHGSDGTQMVTIAASTNSNGHKVEVKSIS